MRSTIFTLAAGLLACATPTFTPARQEVPARWGPYTVGLVDEAGRILPTFQHRGRTYVLGQLGQRYLVRVRNDSGRRAEVVVSVDGRDVIDGRPASWDKRGYLVDPQGEVSIDGFRLNDQAVAAFRFSSVPRSYAAQTGDALDVGVIGVAVFPERAPAYVAPPAEPGVSYQSRPWDAKRRDGERSRETAPEAGGARAKAAPSAPTAVRDAPIEKRPGLGTEFGEERGSSVQRVSFERANARPDAVVTLRYDDRRGLLALGIDVDRSRWAEGEDAWMRETAKPFRRDSGFSEPPPGWTR